MTRVHNEAHLIGRIGWLRAAVLGANDGIISTASLILGVASAAASHTNVLLAGVAGLVAGAMSMAAGEYVSVSSQSDTENADLARERRELANDPEFEKRELADIYVSDSYVAAQKLGERVRASGGAGIIYDSIRQAGGLNIVAHRPRNVLDVAQADHFEIRVYATSRRIELRHLSR